MKKVVSLLTALIIMTLSAVPAFATGQSEEKTGAVDHVIINQVYGGSEDGYASHSFIELYNPTGADVNMNGWSVQYKPSKDGKPAEGAYAWQKLTLTGTIKANRYYLIRCGAVTDIKNVNFNVPAGDQEWDIQLHNKGLSVVLMSNDEPLDDTFAGNVADDGFRKSGFVDLAAVQGNDTTEAQAPPAYEGNYSDIQSKKNAIRRNNFSDTDNNASDFTAVDYSNAAVSPENQPHNSTYQPSGENNGQEGAQEPSYTPAKTTSTKYTGFLNDTATLKAELIARYNSGAFSPDGGSAEISAYNASNGHVYTVNGVKGTLDCFSVNGADGGNSVNELTGTEIKISELVADKDSSFEYGDMTSVAVSPDGKLLAVAIQDADYTKPGKAVVFNCSENGGLTYSGMATTGIQPDMITFDESGALILTANEGEPRNGYEDGAVDPEGSVSIINAADMTVTTIGFKNFNPVRDNLTAAGIIIKKNTDPSVDLEPEYITVSGKTAYVTLQEANAIAILDIDKKDFTSICSVGFQDHSQVAIDLIEDDKYTPATYEALKGIRMPDGISSCVINGETYLITANEGDSREWEEYKNEKKSKTSPNGKTFENNVRWYDTSDVDGLEAGTDYLFGGRSFTMFKVENGGLSEIFDSGSDFESYTAKVLPSSFNCSNDDMEIDSRSGKKGPEPESVTTGTVNGRTYAFIALERIGGVMIYDITDPSNVKMDNYINSRDFSADIKNDVSPEGLCFIAADRNSSGTPLLIASNEVSGTVSVTTLTAAAGQDKPLPPAGGGDNPADDNDAANSNGASETGDDTPVMLFVALVILAAAGTASALVLKRKAGTQNK